MDNNTSFPSKDCHQGRQCSCTVHTLLLEAKGFSRAFPTKGSRLRMTRNSDANWTCRAEAVTEEAKWSAVDIREGIFQSGSSDREDVSLADCLFSQRCPSGFLSQFTSTKVLHERLRSSWVPTNILLYSFCCSSLKVSLTFPRFNPPSLKKEFQISEKNSCLPYFWLINIIHVYFFCSNVNAGADWLTVGVNKPTCTIEHNRSVIASIINHIRYTCDWQVKMSTIKIFYSSVSCF